MPYDVKVGSTQSSAKRVARTQRASRIAGEALALATLCSTGALAASSDLRLSEQGCNDYDTRQLSKLLSLEVETIVSERLSRPSSIFLTCTGRGVSIRVELRDRSATLSGDIDPRGTDPTARTRLLALAITELLAQLWSDNPAPKPSERGPAVVDAGPPTPAPTENDATLYAGIALRSLGEPRTVLFGAALGLEYRVSRAFAVALDIEAARGKVRSEHANVDMVVGSTALHAAIGQEFGRWALGIGPGARIGWVSMSPTELEPNATGSEVSGAWAGPMLLARARWSKDWLALFTSVEAGVVTLPVVGTLNGRAPEVELRGAWLAGLVGLGARF